MSLSLLAWLSSKFSDEAIRSHSISDWDNLGEVQMASINSVVLSGNLGKDPTTKKLPGGDTTVTDFSMAVTDAKKNTSWVKVVSFGKLADFAAGNLKKGTAIGIQGRLQIREYQDKDDKKQFVTEIVADKIDFIGGKREEPAADVAF